MKLFEAGWPVEDDLEDDSDTHSDQIDVVDPPCLCQSKMKRSRILFVPPICRVGQHDGKIGTKARGNDSRNNAEDDSEKLELVWAHFSDRQSIARTALCQSCCED